MSKLLPFLPLMPDESITSYAARVTALHHGGSVRAFLRCFDISYKLIVAGDPDALAGFADLTGVPAIDLTRAALTIQGHTSRYRGEIVQETMLRHARSHVCPRCLITDLATSRLPPPAAVYGRTIWQFSPIRACPRHNVMLEPIREAEHGDKAHDFARTVASSLLNLESRAASAQAVTPSAAEAYLVARFSDATLGSPLLDAMPWYAAARSCEAVGIVALHGPGAGRRGLSETVRRDAAAHGFGIVHGGDARFRDFLDDLRGRRVSRTTGRDDARALYGTLHDVLTYHRPDPAYAPLRQIVYEHALRNVPVGPGTHWSASPSRADTSTRSRPQVSRPASIRNACARSSSPKGSSRRTPHARIRRSCSTRSPRHPTCAKSPRVFASAA